MNDSNSPTVEDERMQEEITAYLDGELSGDDVRRVEQLLASNNEFRDKVKSEQQCWELLDALPRAEADQDFAATTVEMVAVTVAEESDEQENSWLAQMFRQWTLVGVSVLATCIVGFLVTRGVAALLYQTGVLTESDDTLLLTDLPVIENIHKYNLAEDIQFLRTYSNLQFVAEDLLTGQPSNDPPVIPPVYRSDEPATERVDRVAAMSASEKKSLTTKFERFKTLTPDAQQKLREFHIALTTDPEAKQLALALEHYHEWYKHLRPDQHFELRERDSKGRIEYIASIHKEQAKMADRKRVVDDMRSVFQWLEKYALSHEKELIRELPGARVNEFASLPESQRGRRLSFMLWQRWQRTDGPLQPAVSDADFAKLKETLSPEVREELEKAESTDNALRKLLQRLPQQFRHEVPREFATRIAAGGNQQWPRMMAALSDSRVGREELMEFFEHKLPTEHKRRLMRLSPDDFDQQLRGLYMRSILSQRGLRPAAAKGPTDGSAPTVRPNGPGSLRGKTGRPRGAIDVRSFKARAQPTDKAPRGDAPR